MNKEEIKHFKAMLRQGLLRHRDILLNEEFQKELLNIIKDYEKLQQENKELHNKIDKAIDYIEEHKRKDEFLNLNEWQTRELLEILKDSDVDGE